MGYAHIIRSVPNWDISSMEKIAKQISKTTQRQASSNQVELSNYTKRCKDPTYHCSNYKEQHQANHDSLLVVKQ